MNLCYQTAESADFETLSELRIDAMRESLENIGRFDRERSLERFRSNFSPADTQKALLNGMLVGFYALVRQEDHLSLDHLYVTPKRQSLGIGAAMVARVIEESNGLKLPVRLGALKASRSNEFYQRHGFVARSEGEWDICYERPAGHES